jgi:MoxR-like ATPase
VSTTAPAAPTKAPTTADLLARVGEIEVFLNSLNVERKEEIKLLLISALSGIDLLFLGDPGVGKTWAIELLVNYCLTDMTLFTHLLGKDQSVGELLGEKDVMALKRGEIARITKGMLTDSNFAYLDEVFKASPPMLNPLLDIFAKRELKIGGKVINCKNLISIFMSSNELPDREDLFAFRDRIAITKFVEPVKTPDGRRMVTDIQLDYDARGIDTSNLTPLSLAEVQQLRAARLTINVPDAIRDMMGDIEQKCLEAGHPISQRRKRDIWRAVTTNALMRGGDTVSADDFMLAQHMLWNLPDHRDSAYKIITEFASAFTRKAARLREAMEPIVADLEQLRQKVQAADEAERVDLMDGAFKFLRQLDKLKKDGKDMIREGRDQGNDVSMVEEVLSELTRAYDWGKSALLGLDDEDED